MNALAAGLRKFRLKELDDWSDTEIGHIAEVLDLLGDIAGNSRFSDTKRAIEPNLAEGVGVSVFCIRIKFGDSESNRSKDRDCCRQPISNREPGSEFT